MKHLHIGNSEFSLLSGDGFFHSEDLLSHLMDLGARTLAPHEPNFSAKLRELEFENSPGHERDWDQWYNQQMADSLDSEMRRMTLMIEQMKSALANLKQEDIRHYCRERLITDSFVGTEAKRAILKKLAMEKRDTFSLAEKGSPVDGFVGKQAVIIKHYQRTQDDSQDEMTQATTVFYELHEDDVELIYELAG